MSDIFRPLNEPARSIYDAFVEEARYRPNRGIDEWIYRERIAVHTAACAAARKMGLREPTLDEVHSAERYAYGSADYGATWAYRVVEAMRRPAPVTIASHTKSGTVVR